MHLIGAGGITSGAFSIAGGRGGGWPCRGLLGPPAVDCDSIKSWRVAKSLRMRHSNRSAFAKDAGSLFLLAGGLPINAFTCLRVLQRNRVSACCRSA